MTTAADDHGGVRVTVADSGPGVSRSAIDENFEPFVSSKPQRLGMGLAICRSIVNAHAGELTVDKPAEAGAEFSFTLPAIAAAAAPVPGTQVAAGV